MSPDSLLPAPCSLPAAAFPPPGWVTNRKAAEMLGVGLQTLTCSGFKWRPMLRGQSRCVRPPEGGRCNIYPRELVERIVAAQAEAARPRAVPEGFVDKAGAARIMGFSLGVWKTCIRLGKVPFGEMAELRPGRKQRIYKIADVQRLKEELFGADKLYKDGQSGIYHLPAGLLTRQEAWEKFGVGISTWQRWEREGKIACGRRVPSGPKVYRVDDIERLLDEYGKLSPPCPDPDRPGVYRVPLAGRDIQRREALIDADALPLLEGRTCAFSTSKRGWSFVSLSSGKKKSIPLRRAIMGVRDRKVNVRHVNGDPLDCRRENLVVRTVRQRARNTRKIERINGRPPTSRFKGVCWEWATKMWRAQIGVPGRKERLGRFESEIAAARAYDEAAQRCFGEHARLNFPG
jgi:hypothetical protein